MDTIILGAGIAGLTSARHLKRNGRSVLVLEKSPRAGGCIRSVSHNGFLLEKGPNSFLKSHKTVWEHIEQLHLEKEVIASNSSANQRFILEQGKLHPFPKSLLEFLRTPILSPWGKIRFFLEPWIRPRRKLKEESVAQFVSRRFGFQALRLVKPMLQGIYAGDAHHLSIQAIAPQLVKWERKHGNISKAFRKARLFSQGNRLYSFKSGIETLAKGLTQEIKENLFLNCQKIAIKKEEGGWRVQWERDGSFQEEKARHLIISVPAYEASQLLEPIDQGLAQTLHLIPYAPLVVAHLTADRFSSPHSFNGFGFLTGAVHPTPLLGVLWSSSTFEGRSSKPSQVLLTAYLGGAKNPEILQDTDRDLVLKVTEIIPAVPLEITCLPKGLPQYVLGHPQRVGEIQKRLRQQIGLHLVGNYLEGISVNDTMAHVLKTVGGITRDHRD